MIRHGVTERQRARGVAWSAVNAIRSEAARLGLPLTFPTDLDHDEQAILSRAMLDADGRTFGWAIYAYGTFLAWACDQDRYTRERGASHSFMRAVRDTFNRDTPVHFYLYRPGSGLTAVASGADLDEQLTEIERAAREAA